MKEERARCFSLGMVDLQSRDFEQAVLHFHQAVLFSDNLIDKLEATMLLGHAYQGLHMRNNHKDDAFQQTTGKAAIQCFGNVFSLSGQLKGRPGRAFRKESKKALTSFITVRSKPTAS